MIDTSALLPYYREEASSQQVDALLQALKPPVLVSELTRVEMVSAIGRWVTVLPLSIHGEGEMGLGYFGLIP